MTHEQEARDLLERAGVATAQQMSAGDLMEIANLIGEVHRLRAAAGGSRTIDPYLSRQAQAAAPGGVVTREGHADYRLESGGKTVRLGETFRDAKEAIKTLAAHAVVDRVRAQYAIPAESVGKRVDEGPVPYAAAPRDEITLAAAAKESGLAAETWKKQLQKGRVKGRKVGGNWMVEREEVSRYLASRDDRGRQATKRKGRRSKKVGDPTASA